MPACPAGSHDLELAHNLKRHRSPVQLAWQEVKFHQQNFAFRLGKPTGEASRHAFGTNPKTFARARQAGTGRRKKSGTKLAQSSHGVNPGFLTAQASALPLTTFRTVYLLSDAYRIDLNGARLAAMNRPQEFRGRNENSIINGTQSPASDGLLERLHWIGQGFANHSQ